MPSQDVPYAQWRSFLSNFNLRHFGWRASLEQQSGERGKILTADHTFLEELSSDGHLQITIVLGSPFHPFQEHVISNPRRLRAAGSQTSLEIETADGATLIVRVQPPAYTS